ncbi:hypothetical protein [Saccharothrix syringae]|uniref:hypothetical protein n=1 Tax=Saccharothrix syringae TaxID=103733 RepID=UPI000AE562AC|nr:hypothetical protein [Saccharothrix syringae]
MTSTPIFDELVAFYLSDDLPPEPPRPPCTTEGTGTATGVLAQWWSHCERTAG